VEVLDGLKEFDSATIFNAVVEARGATQGGTELEGKGGIPTNFTGPEIRCLSPHLGTAVGYAFTSEMTTSDTDSASIPWDSYYDLLNETPGPKIAVVRDIDTKPGRGACLGDGMAAMHKMLGVTGAIVDGSVRDIVGIERVGLPTWSRGLVPGHGVFNLIRLNQPVVVGQLLVHPGELLIADRDGMTKIPAGTDPAAVLAKAREIRDKESRYHELFKQPGVTLAKIRQQSRKIFSR
jgi:regulator of RNase E activity RraA